MLRLPPTLRTLTPTLLRLAPLTKPGFRPLCSTPRPAAQPWIKEWFLNKSAQVKRSQQAVKDELTLQDDPADRASRVRASFRAAPRRTAAHGARKPGASADPPSGSGDTRLARDGSATTSSPSPSSTSTPVPAFNRPAPPRTPVQRPDAPSSPSPSGTLLAATATHAVPARATLRVLSHLHNLRRNVIERLALTADIAVLATPGSHFTPLLERNRHDLRAQLRQLGADGDAGRPCRLVRSLHVRKGEGLVNGTVAWDEEAWRVWEGQAAAVEEAQELLLEAARVRRDELWRKRSEKSREQESVRGIGMEWPEEW